jgi:hypothetical protein
MIGKVLVIEDNAEEATHAQSELVRAGLNDFKTVTNLADALDAMPQYSAVLTDLFFPLGNLPSESYFQRFLPFYDQFKQRRFTKTKGSTVLRAVEQCARAFGVTPRDYVEKFMAQLNTPQFVLEKARDAITDSEKYEKFLKIEEAIRNGSNLPLGIISSEKATEQGTPCVIVTSTYHHDDAFEPVRGLIQVPYRDTLVEGKKDWKGGIELLLRH